MTSDCSTYADNPLLIEVSLYGSSPEYYERITRVKGSFARFVNGLELLKKSGLNFVLKPVVLRQNFQDYEAMLAFADSKGYRLRFRFSPCLLPSGRHRNDFRLSDGEMVELFRHAPEQAEAVFAKCGIGQGGLVVGRQETSGRVWLIPQRREISESRLWK